MLQVRTAKPMVDSSTPRQFPHIVAKQKKQQVRRKPHLAHHQRQAWDEGPFTSVVSMRH